MTQQGNRPGQLRGRRMGGMGHGPMMMAGEKARDFKGTIGKLVRYLGPYRISLIVVLIFAVASTVFSIVGPKILGQATTRLFEGVLAQLAGAGSGIDFPYIGNIVLLMVGLYALSAVFAYIQGWVMSGISADVTYRFRKEIAQKINRMSLKYFDGTNHGEVLSRITNDVDTVSQTLNQSLSQIVTSVTTVVGVLVMMISISWLMTLVSLLIIPLSLLVTGQIIRRSQKYFKQQQDYLGHVNGHVEEMYGGHIVMKAYNGEQKSVETFNKLNDTLFDSAWRSQFLSGMMMPIMNFIGNLGYVAVVIMGGWMAIRNTITVGDIQAFIQYVRSFTQPITQLANISNVLQQTAAAAERVFEFLAEPEEVLEDCRPDPAGKRRRTRGVSGCALRLQHGQDHHQRFLGGDPAGATSRHCRANRRGQDHDGQIAHAVLRRQQRRHLDRRPQHPGLHAAGPAKAVRNGAAGHMAL